MREHHSEATGHHAAALVIGRRIRSALLAGVSAETPGATAWDVSAETSGFAAEAHQQALDQLLCREQSSRVGRKR